MFVVDHVAHKNVKAIKVGPRPRSIAFLPDGSRAFVTSETGWTLTDIDTKALTARKTIRLGENMRAMGVIASPDGQRLYVSTGRSKMVLIVDVKKDAVIGSVEVGPRPWGIGLSPDAKTLFTANGPSNDVTIVDLASGQVTKKVEVGKGPWGLAVVAAP